MAARQNDAAMAEETVLGVDWHRRGWVAVVLGPAPPAVRVGDDLGALIAAEPGAACVAVDMPIGLAERRLREADSAARAFVGPRRMSVFATPPAKALEAATYDAAKEVARALTGKMISRQAWALGVNIKRVAEVAAGDARVIEVHPEVSFAALAGTPLRFAKTTWNGQALRRRLLARAGIELPEELEGDAGLVPVADVLDAAAAAWSARRYARGEAKPLPEGAARGGRQVIWY